MHAVDSEICMRISVSDMRVFNNSEWSWGHILDLLWGCCPQGDTEGQMQHWSCEKAFNRGKKKKKSMFWVVTNKPHPQWSNTGVVIISQRAMQHWGTIITVQMECILIQLSQRSGPDYLSMHMLSQVMKWIKMCRAVLWCPQCALVSLQKSLSWFNVTRKNHQTL